MISLNEQVALKRDWTKCPGKECREGRHWLAPWQTNHRIHNRIPDYVGDIAEAMTLIPEKGAVRIARNMMGTWSCSFSGEPGERGFGITLSAAILDAILAAKGASDG